MYAAGWAEQWLAQKDCIHRQDKSVLSPRRCPLPRELERLHCVGADQAEVENGQVRSVGGAQKLHWLCWKPFFPICSWKGEAVVKNKKQRDPLIHQWSSAKLAWVFGVSHGASLQLQWSQERCKKGNPFSWPYLGWNLPCSMMYSPDCAPWYGPHWQAQFSPVYIKPSCCLGIFSYVHLGKSFSTSRGSSLSGTGGICLGSSCPGRMT